MKQLISPIAIIVGLIAFFVIIDRKEFNRHDDVQTVQSESSTTNRKPTVSVPETKSVTEIKPAVETKTVVETKPMAETKPVTEAKPVTETKPKTDVKSTETKPVAETKPAEAKPVTEAKPEEKAKPVTEAKPEEKAKPTAVPVVSAEEAKMLNEEAIAWFESEKLRREPFWPLYKDIQLSTVFMEGTIRDASFIPDPQNNDYPDCLYSLMIEVNSFSFPNSPDKTISQELIINVPIMKDEKILQDNIFRCGDKFSLTCTAYDGMPDKVKEIQVSDDYQSFEHDYYYVLKINKTKAFSNTGSKKFSKRQITVLPVKTLEKDEMASKKRSDRINSEIERIEDELSKHGGSFTKWKEEYKPIGDKYKELVKDKFECWIGDSFFSAGGTETGYSPQKYIEGILPYKKFLEEKNIDLLLVRMPSKADFAARVLANEEFYENPAWVEFQYTCLKNDLEIVDPMPEMWNHRLDFPLFYYFHTSESHPFEGAYYTVAKCVSDVLKRYKSFKRLQGDDELHLVDAPIKGTNESFFWPRGNEKFDPKEKITFKEVWQKEESIEVQSNTSSPFVFLSNSYGGRYLVSTLSIANYTAYFLQHIPDWSYQVSLFNAMLRNLVVYPERLSKRSCVIMICMPSMYNSAFPPFPKYISDGANCITLEQTLEFLSDDMEIIDDNHYVIAKEQNGGVSVKLNPDDTATSFEKAFHVLLTIPAVKGKGTCMLRVNFKKSGGSSFTTIDDETQSIIESSCEPPRGDNQHVDLFVPVTEKDRKLKLKIACSNPQVLDNIELWYY